MRGLTESLAERFATSTLAHLGREWPGKLDHAMAGPEDVAGPKALHPIFHGSYDWHSCVHGWWQVMRIARRFPDLPVAAAIRARADSMLTPEKAAGELAYLARPASGSFERPYGWGWLLALNAELSLHRERHWAAAVEPLARAFTDRFRAYLPKLTWPVRHGNHGNTAFALILAYHWAEMHDVDLAMLIGECASGWFAGDRACQIWEPGGEDFLSPALCEAALMAQVTPPAAFGAWLSAFLPEPGALLNPAIVTDRSDGRIAHLDGLNLSRAWCWRRLAAHPATEATLVETAQDAADAHLAASLPHLFDDYMGEHWLATFALLALDDI